VGRVLKSKEAALTKLADFQKRQKTFLSSLPRNTCKKSILIQVGSRPLVVVGGNSYLNDAIETLGCKNVYSDLKQAYPRPSIEDVISRNPDTILILAMNDKKNLYEGWTKEWKGFERLKATQNQRIFVFRSDALMRPSLRWTEGLQALHQALDQLQ